jgi:hypothetical protein
MGESSPITYPHDMTTGPICGIAAIAIAADISLSEAREIFLRRYPQHGNWRGRTTPDQIKVVMEKDMGLILTSIKHQKETLGKFMSWNLDRDTIYWVRITGHFIIAYNNHIYDQYYDRCHIDDCTWKRRHVTHAWSIQKPNV